MKLDRIRLDAVYLYKNDGSKTMLAELKSDDGWSVEVVLGGIVAKRDGWQTMWIPFHRCCEGVVSGKR